MKKKLLCLVGLWVPLFPLCQQASTATLPANGMKDSTYGVNWTEGLSWQQVKEKAKKENKFIFLDCYATWCKPCKKMDKEVYTVDSVGNYLNERFISVKLQMDITKNDNEEVKSWRKTASDIETEYRISAFPSYVFFAPTGEVVSKETGYKNPGAFIQVARNATDPSKQYFVLLKRYKQGKLNHAGTVSLITMAQQIGDTVDYRLLLNSYYAYLHKHKKAKLYTKESIEFVASTLDRSSMVLFDMFHPDGKEVNRVMGSDWYSKKVVDKIINSENVQPFLKNAKENNEPDWNILYRLIERDYGDDYAGRNVLDAKTEWYTKQGDGLRRVRALNEKMERYGWDTTDLVEDFRAIGAAYFVWMGVGRTTQLSKEMILEFNRICNWVEGITRRGEKLTDGFVNQWHDYIDTYAHLLHKAGRTAEAIRWEEFAVLKMKETVKDEERAKALLQNYTEVLNKMIKGEPTWPIDQK